jgi:uncharacterized protein YggE
MNSLFSNTPMKLLGAMVVFMFLLALGSYATLNFEKAKHLEVTPATISVTGEGEVFVVPDIGQFTFSVRAEAADAAAAQEESGTQINDIIAFLKETGVADADIKTTNYSLYPKYRWEERLCVAGSYCGPGEQIQDGFEVNQSVQVKVRNTDDASAVLAGVGERGATNISGLDFVVDDTDALVEEARAKAIVDAKQKASALAKDLGVTITRLAGYHDEGSRYVEPQMFNTRSFDMQAEAAFDGPSLPVGEEQTTARVTITYEVK